MNNTELIQRLEKLELDNRRMKRASIAALTAAMATLLMGQATAKSNDSDTIVARAFVVADANGRQRAILTATDTSSRLTLGGEELGGGMRIVIESHTDNAPRAFKNSGQITLGTSKYPSIQLFADGEAAEVSTNNLASNSSTSISATSYGAGLESNFGTLRASVSSDLDATEFRMSRRSIPSHVSWRYSSEGAIQHMPSGRIIDMETGRKPSTAKRGNPPPKTSNPTAKDVHQDDGQ